MPVLLIVSELHRPQCLNHCLRTTNLSGKVSQTLSLLPAMTSKWRGLRGLALLDRLQGMLTPLRECHSGRSKFAERIALPPLHSPEACTQCCKRCTWSVRKCTLPRLQPVCLRCKSIPAHLLPVPSPSIRHTQSPRRRVRVVLWRALAYLREHGERASVTRTPANT